MKTKYKRLLLLLSVLLFLLAACAGDVPKAPAPLEAVSPSPAAEAVQTAAPIPSPETPPPPSENTPDTPTSTPTPTPLPSPPPDPSSTPQPAAEDAPTCTLSISCATLLDRLDQLPQGKGELVPADGWLLAPTQVPLEEGDSVFDLLLRVCREKGIHMEFSLTPGLGTAYIEGIGNLYQFDCGDLSGWVFAVDGVSPSVSCSDAFPARGDQVQWCYTCDLGDDLPQITRG